MIGLSAQDLYPVSLYMNKERVLAEDFCKLIEAWTILHTHNNKCPLKWIGKSCALKYKIIVNFISLQCIQNGVLSDFDLPRNDVINRVSRFFSSSSIL